MNSSPQSHTKILIKKRKVVRIVSYGAILFAPIFVAAAVNALSPDVAAAAIGVGALGLFTVVSIFLITYWRCPACGQYFGRRQNGSHCSHCDARFDIDKNEPNQPLQRNASTG